MTIAGLAHRSTKIASLAALAVTTLGSGVASANVVLHAFEWKYQDVEARAPEIAAIGYKAVLVAPPLKSECYGSRPWYKRYQPEDYRVIDNCMGNKEQFVSMLKALNRNGVHVYADVVLNHMANERGNATAFPGRRALAEYETNADYWERQRLYGDLKVGLFSKRDFHERFCIVHSDVPNEVVKGRICKGQDDPGLPDLDDTNPGPSRVLEQRRAYLRALFDLGVRGFRLDAAKHMPVAAIQSVFDDDLRESSHIFGEIMTGGGPSDPQFDRFLKPYLQKLPASFGAYDFPLLNAIRMAFRPLSHFGNYLADPTAHGNALESRRAVTVVVTHDVPNNEELEYMILQRTDEWLGYAYIIGRDGGTPLVFDDGSTDKPYAGRWVGVWKDDGMRRMVSFHNRMQGKPMEMLFSDECALLWRRDEDGIVAINKCGSDKVIPLNTQGRLKWHVNYREAITQDPNNALRIETATHVFKIPARSARMWYLE